MLSPSPLYSFKRDISVFEPQLFDIYLSYSQKTTTTTVTVNATPKTSAATPIVPNVQLAHMSEPKMPFDHTVIPLPNMVIPPTAGMWQAQMQALPVSKESQLTKMQLLVSNGNTIYDSELQLLTDRTEQSVQKVVEEYSTFKHGSFLLYPQRGLLDTFPLEYTCHKVSGNATVKAPNMKTIRKSASETTTSSVPMTPITNTSGYHFPTVSGPSSKKPDKVTLDTSSQERNSNSPLPSSLSNISVFPQELVMHIDSVKSGASYAVTLKLGSCEVALTDLCIQSSNVMSSVCVEVWSCKGEEHNAVRVAYSSELAHKSLSLGNISPPPICQFVKVSEYQISKLC